MDHLDKKTLFLIGDTRGFTLAEILMVLAILGIISSLLLSVFFNLNRYRALERDAAEVRAYLEEARIYTQGSHHASSYGVRFEEGSVELFRGDSWEERHESIKDHDLDPSVSISVEGLNGNNEVVFQRLFGEPDVSGEIILSGFGRDIIIDLLSSGFVE